ncbi:MAG: fluoride efflux transporter CrcB [Micrococcales bacterium]|nr:fluoride efflux transporter CrcB [Micrococcales bacterium]
MNAVVWACLAVAGGLGAVGRFLLDGAASRRASGPFPWGTFVVNISGAAALGLLSGVGLPDDVYLVVGAGVVGAYTTFSTWMFETQRLIEERLVRVAVLNVVVSIVVGVAAAWIGHRIGGLL